jgi:predicted outer membrane repeat protein
MLRTRLIATLVLLLLSSAPSSARAGGVVNVCDEAHLRSALAGGGVVTFACSGVIPVSATIFITADTTIDGTGQAVTLNGNQAVRIMTVTEGVTLHLRDLAFVNGDWAAGGGALYNAGTATVNRCTFTNNNGAISNSGALAVADSTFTGNSTDGAGGAIYTSYYTTLIVSNSTFSGNSTRYSGGGAIANNSLGIVTVSNSTFNGNSAGATGGAISNGYDRDLTVVNCTFSGNSAALMGGTLYNSGSHMTLANSVIVTSQGGSACDGSAIIDGGGNLSYPDSSCPGIHGAPLLGPLQDNGGWTHTMALGQGSAAIDAGDDGICAGPLVSSIDQRGVTRPQGSHCDIGAYEVGQAATATPTPTITPTPTATSTPTSVPTPTATTQPAAPRVYLPVILK